MPPRRDKLLQFDTKISSSRISAMRVEPRMMGFLAVVLLLIGLAGWLYLYQTSIVAGYSREIRELQERKSELREDIGDLQAKLAMTDSLEEALALGEERGYTLPSIDEPGRHVVLTIETAPIPSDTTAVEPEPPDIITADWGDRVLERLDRWITTPSQPNKQQ